MNVARGRKITARVVKRALKEIQPSNPEPAEAPALRPNKAERRRIINESIGQLLMLLSQKAAHEVLTQKVL